MSKQVDAGSVRPVPVLHRPFEDGDTQRHIQCSLIRHQFPGFVDVAVSQSIRAAEGRPGPPPEPLPQGPTSAVRQLAEERLFVPLRSMTSAGEELEGDDDDTVDSASFNISSNTTSAVNGQH